MIGRGQNPEPTFTVYWEVMTLNDLKWAGIALALALPLAAAPAAAQRTDGIAAVVNDEVVLQSDVEEQLDLLLLSNQVTPDSTMVDTLRLHVLNQLIDAKLIVAEAKRQGITVNDAEVEQQVTQALRDVKERLGGEQGFRQQLARENLTEEKLRQKYRDDLRRQLLGQRLLQKQLPKKTVTAGEAEAYFKENHAKFPRVPSEMRLQVIQIPARPDSVTDAKAKKRALDVRKRLSAGEKFAKLAAEVSEDPGTARSGGDLGFFTRGTMDPALETAAFGLKPGQVSQPVRSAFGWHVIESLERDTLKTRAGRDSTDKDGGPMVEIHVRHILIRTTITEADVERTRKLAERVRSEAIKGTPFGTLVRRYSEYEGQQGEDGDVGFVSLGTLQPNIRAGLDSLEVGQISEPLANPLGLNIFKVTDRKPEREYQLDEIREELPEVVAQMKQRDRYEEWIKGLRSKAHIEIRSS